MRLRHKLGLIALVGVPTGWSVGGLVSRTNSKELTIAVIDVGQGDGMVIMAPSGATMIVDTGGTFGNDNMGRKAMVPYLKSHGISRVAALILTHPDLDHIGGAGEILRRVQVDRLLVSTRQSGEPELHNVLELARSNRVPVTEIGRGQTLRLGNEIQITTLNPGQIGRRTRTNDMSLVLRLVYGSTSFMLTGDAEGGSENRMLSSGRRLSADVLKLGHHGSHTSTSQPFLQAVHPALAIASCGAGNRFGHPHPDVMARLKAAGVKVLRTDQNGTIELKSDGRRIFASTLKPSYGSPSW